LATLSELFPDPGDSGPSIHDNQPVTRQQVLLQVPSNLGWFALAHRQHVGCTLLAQHVANSLSKGAIFRLHTDEEEGFDEPGGQYRRTVRSVFHHFMLELLDTDGENCIKIGR